MAQVGQNPEPAPHPIFRDPTDKPVSCQIDPPHIRSNVSSRKVSVNRFVKIITLQPFFVRPFVSMQRMYSTLKGDFSSIFLLLGLYILQGIPLGLISAIPLILQSKKITYAQQAVFSFANWPFSLKLLWAPVVDSVFVRRFGRRKSWMVPCQYLIGIFLLFVSYYVPEILGTNGAQPNVFFLMAIFLPLNFLAATQDIAVDGWALTMLSRKNVGYASTCNVVGQTLGFFMGNALFLTLQSKNFANKWIRSEPKDTGLVEFDGFVFFWGWVFIAATTLVMIFKHEVDHSQSVDIQMQKPGEVEVHEAEVHLNVFETYTVLFKILCLRPMHVMVAMLLTAKVAFAAADSMTDLKLINAGVTTDKIASRSILLTPLQIILPWLLGKQTAGPKPLNVFLLAYPLRIVMDCLLAALVYFIPVFKEGNEEFSYTFYIIWIGLYYFLQISSYCIFLSIMAFNAQISDPKIGGTYMTLLNTLNNLGAKWPTTFVLAVTDFFNKKNCISAVSKSVIGSCTKKLDEELCKTGGDTCEFEIDGFYISSAICTVLGLLWIPVFYRKIRMLQNIPRAEWRVIKPKIK